MVTLDASKGELELNALKAAYKKPKSVSGFKLGKLKDIMTHLENIMLNDGATNEMIKRFEYDFLTSNGVAVPDTFFITNPKKSIGDYISNYLSPSNKNITGKQFYEDYCAWCKHVKVVPMGKKAAFEHLNNDGILSPIGTVNGKTYNNVIKNMELNHDWEGDENVLDR